MIVVHPVQAPTTARPRVSVAIACYNYARFLPTAVASALTQQGVQVDVTIVDDASTDESLLVAHRLADRDERVRVVALARNSGPVVAATEALSRARSPYVVKLDADDALPAGSLAHSAALLDAVPAVSLVYGRVDTFTEAPPTERPRRVRAWRIWAGEEWLATRFRRPHATIRQPEAMMRRSALDVVGTMRPHIVAASDFAMWLRLATVGSVGYIAGPTQGYYRVHAASLQRTVHAGLLHDLRERVLAFDCLFDERWNALSDPAGFQRRARRSLARDAVRLAARALDHRAEDEPIDAYLALAREQDPGVTATAAWLAVAGRRAIGRRAPALAARTPGAAAREVEDRVRWRRWRWSGI